MLKPGPAQELSANPTYLEAVGAALDHEMERDPDVFIIGEDVGQFGGAFKVTKGFLDKYGPRRVVDAPIAETGFTGLAAGAALVGLRPVVEFQFADFISCAFDPIINVLARHHWRTGDPMPVTMRAPFGGRLRAGPTHSQSVESYFAHVPGLKIVMPGTPEDAAGLLISSIRDNNPTLYLENKYLYRRLRATGPLSMEPIPLGVAKVVREGRDVTLITYSAGVHQGVEVAAGARQGRHLGRGRRRPHAGAAGRRDDRELGEEDLPRGGAARGGQAAGLRRGDRGDDPGGGLLAPGPADRRGSRRRTRRRDQPAAGGRDHPAARGDRGDAAEGGAGMRMEP